MSLRYLVPFILTIFITSFGIGQPSNAENIRVKSGEHADFTRLVLYFKNETEWDFGRVESGFEFRVLEGEATYLIQGIFDLIPRSRIQEIQDLGDGRVFLKVDCDCHGDAFVLPQGQVVLDIKDGPAPANVNAFNALLEPLTQLAAIPDISPIANEPPDNPFDARRGLPLLLTASSIDMSGPDPEQPPTALAQFGEAALPSSDANTPFSDPLSVEAVLLSPISNATSEQRVVDAERHLLEQISRAATQGLLEPDLENTLGQIEEIPEPDVLLIPETQVQTPAPLEGVGNVDGLESHVMIVTAIDSLRQAELPTTSVTGNGKACLNGTLFSITEWGENVADGAYLGRYRSGVLGEFDVVRPTQVKALIQRYIYLTFGAEAIEIVETMGSDLNDMGVFLVLADIMDNLHSDRSESWIQYLECSGRVALWAALSQENLQEDQVINSSAITAAFSELPVHLRQYLGPILAERLINANKAEAANSIRSAIMRASDGHNVELDFLNAQLAIDQKQPEAAIKTLERIISNSSELAPKALQELIEYKVLQGFEITEQEVMTIATYAYEYRGSEVGIDLAQLEIFALAETARFSEAFEKIDMLKTGNGLDIQTVNKAFLHLLGNLVEKGQDAVFLRYTIGFPLVVSVPKAIRIKVATRLNELGLQQIARSFLGRSAQVPDPQERRLFAQIALDEQKYDVTIGYLAGLGSNDDLRLRAEAYAGKQDLQEAAQILGLIGDQKGHLQVAWRAGDWKQVLELDDGLLGAASALMLRNVFEPSDLTNRQGALAVDSTLLAESQHVREIVSQMLSQVSVEGFR